MAKSKLVKANAKITDAVVAAFMAEPDIYILDEPSTGLSRRSLLC